MSRSLRQYASSQGASLNSGGFAPLDQAVASLQLAAATWDGTIAGQYNGFSLNAIGGSDRVQVQGVTQDGTPWSASVRWDRLQAGGDSAARAIFAAGRAQKTIPQGLDRNDILDSDIELDLDWDELYT